MFKADKIYAPQIGVYSSAKLILDIIIMKNYSKL